MEPLQGGPVGPAPRGCTGFPQGPKALPVLRVMTVILLAATLLMTSRSVDQPSLLVMFR